MTRGRFYCHDGDAKYTVLPFYWLPEEVIDLRTPRDHVEGRIRHGRHPVLDWNMANVTVDQDAAGNIKPNKKKSTEKIDGVVALVMGFARATIGGGTEFGSVYDDRGLLIF